MKLFRHIVLVALAIVVIGSCRGPKRMSRSDMMDIYHDMFLLDQQIRNDAQYRRHADTVLVYESIFNKYGYDTDDYLYSVEYYLLDPERFAKMLSEVSDRLKEEGQEVGRQIELADWRSNMMKLYGMQADTILPRQRDTLWSDTLFIVRDDTKSLFFKYVQHAVADTLVIPMDTLSVRTDSLTTPPDSLKTEER